MVKSHLSGPLLAASVVLGVPVWGLAAPIYDQSGDGVSDVWEARYGLPNPSAVLDADSDGRSDRDEGLEGTDPFDADSVLELEVTEQTQDDPLVTWGSVAGRSYQVQGLDVEGRWADVGTPLAGNGALLGFVHSLAGGNPPLAYRIMVVRDAGGRPEMEDELMRLDSDQDGQRDWSEWLAGTSMIDPESRLEITGVNYQGSRTLSWFAVEGMSYRLQCLGGSGWEDVEGVFLGDGNRQSHSLASDESPESFRIVAEAPDTDEDGVTDWEELLAGLDPFHAYSRYPERTDLEVVGDELDEGGVISLEAVGPVLNMTEGGMGAVRLRREAGLADVTVPLQIAGDALPGVDFEALPATVNLSFGATELEIPVRFPSGTTPTSGRKVEVTVGTGPQFQLGVSTSRDVTLLEESLINVKDHGAVGDGQVDDTVAIQAAIDALATSPTHNGLLFPEGTYRLATLSGGLSSYRLLQLDSAGLADRDIVLRGEGDAVLYSDVGPSRASMLSCVAYFRSLVVRDLRFEQSPQLLWPTPGYEPNGSDGVTIRPEGLRPVEEISFRGCEFVNCHRSVSVLGRGYDLRGKCGVLAFDDCRILNPYGSNTFNGGSAWGGGQQVYIASWVAEARYEDCVFEGGGEDMTDAGTSPAGRLKDGCHFGSPMRLVFRGNVVRRMGVEAIFQVNDNTFMGGTTGSIVVPAPDDTTEVVVTVGSTPSSYVAGESIVIRTPLSPGQTPSNTFFTMRGFDPVSRALRLTNPGHPENPPAGTIIPSGRSIFLDERWEATRALFKDNYVNGEIPPGSTVFDGHSGISFDARAEVTGNFVTGYGRGIYSPDEVQTPAHPAARGSVVEGNIVITEVPREESSTYTYGMWVWGSDESIRDNVVYTPVGRRVVGIVVRGEDARVTGNTLIAMEPVVNGYGSQSRAVGVGMGDTSENTKARGNSTRGFDVGIGPARAYQEPPYFLGSHFSIGDVLGVDERGLQSE